MEHVQKVLQKMDASLKNLETDLQNSKVPQGEHDQFYAVMSVSFYHSGQKWWKNSNTKTKFGKLTKG